MYYKILVDIERYGIGIDIVKYNSKYNIAVIDNVIHSMYNQYTKTGRPTNNGGGVNFMAMNKTDGTRSFIVSRHKDGRLFEFDYESYHPRLIAHLIGYELPDGNIHEYFAKQYFGDVEMTADIYDRSKKLTFAQMYGAFKPEYQYIEFFAKIQEYINQLWDDFKTMGYVKTPITGRRFNAEWYGDDIYKSKLFNYIIQNYETEMNLMVVGKIQQYLYKMKSGIVLYNYDSILIDYHPHDNMNILTDIKNIMSVMGFPVTVEAGVNYHDMVNVTI